jgi:hypothetical protein
MNCYYSNLIEGHNTHPVEIERALKGEYSSDRKKRDLQIEAKAHFAVQQWIDAGGLRNRRAAIGEGICETHFGSAGICRKNFSWSKIPNHTKRIRMAPGELRPRDVQVGASSP